MSTIQETSENLLRFCGDQKYATIYADPPGDSRIGPGR